jgi:hypothetical protein
MRRYPASLAAWRAALPADPAPQLRLYLRVFAAVLAAMQARRARRMPDDNQPLPWICIYNPETYTEHRTATKPPEGMCGEQQRHVILPRASYHD